jgi:hypothetical protein
MRNISSFTALSHTLVHSEAIRVYSANHDKLIQQFAFIIQTSDDMRDVISVPSRYDKHNINRAPVHAIFPHRRLQYLLEHLLVRALKASPELDVVLRPKPREPD